MSMTILEAFSLQDEISHPTARLCGLCGNCGMINTVGKIFSPAGVECGVNVPCICANGRATKRRLAHGAQKGESKPPQTFWVSWEDYSWKQPALLGPRLIASWESGQAGDGSYVTIVAWVFASNVAEVIEAVSRDYPCAEERRWRFICPHEPGWTPGNRFPLNETAEAKLQQLKEAE